MRVRQFVAICGLAPGVVWCLFPQRWPKSSCFIGSIYSLQVLFYWWLPIIHSVSAGAYSSSPSLEGFCSFICWNSLYSQLILLLDIPQSLRRDERQFFWQFLETVLMFRGCADEEDRKTSDKADSVCSWCYSALSFLLKRLKARRLTLTKHTLSFSSSEEWLNGSNLCSP